MKELLFPWEKESFVPATQHGCRAKPLLTRQGENNEDRVTRLLKLQLCPDKGYRPWDFGLGLGLESRFGVWVGCSLANPMSLNKVYVPATI